jgi:hypothetical protein
MEAEIVFETLDFVHNCYDLLHVKILLSQFAVNTSNLKHLHYFSL